MDPEASLTTTEISTQTEDQPSKEHALKSYAEADYLIQNKIGAGHFGQVFICLIAGLTFAAEKLFTFHHFEQELFVHSTYLSTSQGICRAISFDPSNHFIFFPLLREEEGWVPLNKCKIVLVSNIKALLLSICTSVKNLHHSKLTHNDIKADNFMTNGTTATMIDLGNATHQKETEIPICGFTRSCHIHPLIREHKMPYCIAGDVFSIGEMVHYMGSKWNRIQLKTLDKTIKKMAITDLCINIPNVADFITACNLNS